MLRTTQNTKTFNQWRFVFLVFPSVAIFIYLLWSIIGLAPVYETKSFTLEQRLLTQARVMWTYVASILFPLSDQFALFHDDIPTSISLISPKSTLPAIIAWIIIFSIGLWNRRRWPIVAFGLMWYLSGHLIESTVIPLEMKFEHRNYLPSISLIAMLVWLSVTVLINVPQRIYRLLIGGIAFTWLLNMVLVSLFVSHLWTDRVQQSRYWYEQGSDSLRNTYYWLSNLTMLKQPGSVVSLAQTMQNRWAQDINVHFALVSLKCQFPSLKLLPLAEIESVLATERLSAWALQFVDDYHRLQASGACAFSEQARLIRMLETVLKNPFVDPMVDRVHRMIGVSHVLSGNIGVGFDKLDRLFALTKNPSISLWQAEVSFQLGQWEKAQHYLRVSRRYLDSQQPQLEAGLRELGQRLIKARSENVPVNNE